MIDLGPPPFVFPKPAIIRPADAEMLRYGGDPLLAMLPGMTPVIRPNPYCLEAQALFAAMTTQPSGVRKSLIDETIRDLKAAGLWSGIDALFVFAAHDATEALLNWKAPNGASATLTGAPAFTTDRGYAKEASTATSYVNTGWAVGDGSAVQDSTFVVVYLNVNNQVAGDSCAFANTTGGADPGLWIRPSTTAGGGELESKGNCTTATDTTVNSTLTGWFSISRTASTEYAVCINKTTFETVTQTSASPSTVDIGVLNRGSGVDGAQLDGRAALFVLGSGLSKANQDSLYDILVTDYLAVIGAN